MRSGICLFIANSLLAIDLMGAASPMPTGTPAAAAGVLSVTAKAAGSGVARCSTRHGGHALSIPNDTCKWSITLTTTGPGALLVRGTDAVPADRGRAWTLCGAARAACAGAVPGRDQYTLALQSAQGGPSMTLSTDAQCDVALTGAGTCAAATGTSYQEVLTLSGPAASSDTSSSFETTITWLLVAR